MKRIAVALLAVAALVAACAPASRDDHAASAPGLGGAWRSAVRFKSGPFAAVHDLEFMYVFNAGGTMTESSNYDGAPPVPPAYGVWRKTGPDTYAAKYTFYVTRPPAGMDEIVKGGGWLPAGRGVLDETITLAPDGRTFASTIRYAAFDIAGKPAEGGGEAEGRGERFGF